MMNPVESRNNGNIIFFASTRIFPIFQNTPELPSARTNYDRWQKMSSVLKKTRCFDICRDVRSHFYFFFALPLGIFLNRRLGAPQGGHE